MLAIVAVDDYITSCYTVEEFNETYSYCLMPVEGMQSWPQSDRPPLEAPGYVKMPGRPKKERKRESHEKPKAAKISRVGTVIRCRKCKGIGHNKSTCDKRNGGQSGGIPVNAENSAAHANFSDVQATPNVVSTTQQSSAGTRGTTSDTINTETTNTTVNRKRKAATKDDKGTKSVVRSSAKAKVHTTSTGRVEINLHAIVPSSQASSSVTINMTSGKAQAHVEAQEPSRKKLQVRRSSQAPVLLLGGPSEQN